MKFALETSVFVDAFRDETFAEALAGFLEQALPSTFLSAVVVQELTAGARTRQQLRELESSIVRPFERRGRVFAPSPVAFKESGRLLADLAAVWVGQRFIKMRPWLMTPCWRRPAANTASRSSRATRTSIGSSRPSGVGAT